MELITYVRVVRRWLWLILLVGVLAGGIAYLIAKSQALQYQAAITIQVGSAQYSQNPATDQLLTSQQLADTYAVIVKTYPVLEATVDHLQLDMKPSDLSRIFQVSIIPGTSLLRISVTYTDPDKTAEIANELGAQLIANSPISSMSEQQAREGVLNDEINATLIQLEQARERLAETDSQIDAIEGEVPTALTEQHDEIIQQINEAQSNLALLTNTLAYLQKEGGSNSLQVVEQARVPTQSSNSSPLILTMVLAILASGLTAGIFVIREFLSDNVRNPSDLNARFGLNILGTIAPFKGKKGSGLIMWTQPRSTIAESYRVLRDNLIHIERNTTKKPRVYIVTSPNPVEGKSVTAANLAVAFAITGERVLLVDANLHNPTQHSLFNLPNNIGLSDVLTYNKNIAIENFPLPPDDDDAAGNGVYANETLTTNVLPMTAALMSKTEIPGLEVITVGRIASMPAEAFGIPRIQELIYKLASTAGYDTVIFDSSPLLTYSDSTVIASVTRGLVLLVVEPGRTRQGSVVRAVQQLAALSVPLAGVVLNRYDARELDASYGMYTYGRYEPASTIDYTGSEAPALSTQEAKALLKAEAASSSKDE